MTQLIQDLLLYLPVLLFSLSVHEFAHAWAAWKLGDDTAARQGRMTINPLAHIDPIGTILMPVLGILNPGIPILGWAKPVPVNPIRFSRRLTMRRGMLITALAGPASNLVLAVLSTALLRIALELGLRPNPFAATESLGGLLVRFLMALISLNLILAIFNLIPIPPLDGSNILSGIVPRRYDHHLRTLQQYGGFLLILLVLFGGRIIGFPHRLLFSGLLSLFGIH